MINKSLIVILLSTTLSMIAWFFFTYKPIIEKTKKELAECILKYDSLLLAKQDTIIRYDTIVDSFQVTQFIPKYTFDTVYLDKTVEANWYIDSLIDTNVKIDYSILTFGVMKHFDLSYKLAKQDTTIYTIQYVDRIKEVPTYYPKRSISIYNAFSSDLRVFQFGMVYTTKNRLSFSISHQFTSHGDYTLFGIGYGVSF